MSATDYAVALRGLFARANHGIKLGLDTMEALLAALGHPERAVRHVVVAGTNGKGSTSTLVATALRAAGHRVGHYTSPHLLRFTERIRIDGAELTPEAAVGLMARVQAAEGACPRPATFFEVVTAMALCAFADAGVELAVLEVGMGGRLDATNAVDKLLSVVTRVDLDHQQYLGTTLAAIAFEKAGIIAPGRPAVLSRQHPEAREVLLRVARERGAAVTEAPEAILSGSSLRLELRHGPLVLGRFPPGAYQRENLATAAAAARELDALGVGCPDRAIADAAAAFHWPGRYEWLDGTPPVLVDGAHNPAGIAALLAALDEDPRARGRNLHIIATVLADRPAAEMLPPLATRAASLHLTPVPSARSRTPEELATLGVPATVHCGVGPALEAACARARAEGGVVVACGSLFLVGEALALLRGEPRDPPIDA
jgi:dihydrofolate synthase/folylpolyglutamate synthase